MTAKELYSELRLNGALDSADPREIFLCMAAHAYELRLADGSRVLDATDFAAILLELVEAAKPFNPHENAAQGVPNVLVANVRNLAASKAAEGCCPDCHHVHEGPSECGKYLGEMKFCKCELQVPA